MMKRKVILLLTLVLLLTLCCCGKKNNGTTWQEQYDLGVRYLSDGNYEEAIIAFTAAIEIDPKRPEAYLGLVGAYIGTGNLDAARKALEDGLAATGDPEIQTKLDELSARAGNLTAQLLPKARPAFGKSWQSHRSAAVFPSRSGGLGISLWHRCVYVRTGRKN